MINWFGKTKAVENEDQKKSTFKNKNSANAIFSTDAIFWILKKNKEEKWRKFFFDSNVEFDFRN